MIKAMISQRLHYKTARRSSGCINICHTEGIADDGNSVTATPYNGSVTTDGNASVDGIAEVDIDEVTAEVMKKRLDRIAPGLNSAIRQDQLSVNTA